MDLAWETYGKGAEGDADGAVACTGWFERTSGVEELLRVYWVCCCVDSDGLPTVPALADGVLAVVSSPVDCTCFDVFGTACVSCVDGTSWTASASGDWVDSVELTGCTAGADVARVG